MRDAPGGVAVHSQAGSGRTGTMIALYLMCMRGLSALEAIAYAPHTPPSPPHSFA